MVRLPTRFWIARMRHLMRWFLLVAILNAAGLPSRVAFGEKPDRPGGGSGTELELLPLASSTVYSAAWAINESNLVVGQVSGVAGVWNANLSVPAFSPLPGEASEARDINVHDAIVGWGPTGAKYWSSPAATPIDLPVPEGLNAFPEAISRDGVIVGWTSGDATDGYATVWRVHQNSILGPWFLSSASTAFDVASLGSGMNRVVGAAKDPHGTYVATAWDVVIQADGSLAVSGSVALVSDAASRAYAITEAGDIAGSLDANPQTGFPGFPDTAFVIRNGSLRRLSSGRQNDTGTTADLNDTHVVGVTGQGSIPDQAALWDSRNKLVDLNGYFAESWSTSYPAAINVEGNMVGYGTLAGQEFDTAWLLRHPIAQVVVPEPVSAGIAAGILLALPGHSRRRGSRSGSGRHPRLQ